MPRRGAAPRADADGGGAAGAAGGTAPTTGEAVGGGESSAGAGGKPAGRSGVAVDLGAGVSSLVPRITSAAVPKTRQMPARIMQTIAAMLGRGRGGGSVRVSGRGRTDASRAE